MIYSSESADSVEATIQKVSFLSSVHDVNQPNSTTGITDKIAKFDTYIKDALSIFIMFHKVQ